MTSFFPWMGGKSAQVKHLTGLLADHKCYVELFSGAANLLFAKPKSKIEVINDINSDLVNLFRIVKYHRREFIASLGMVTHSRKEFEDFKAQPGLTDIQRAARTWMILKTAFGGKGGDNNPPFGYATTGRARFNRSALSSVRRCHKRLEGVFVENLDFAECIRRYDRPHTLFYCDPPYLETHGYKAPFGFDQHVQLARCLKAINGKFLLSINDHPKIRALYKGLARIKVEVKYTVSRVKTSSAQDRTELIIANYPLPKQR